jgi:hypothetical protein
VDNRGKNLQKDLQAGDCKVNSQIFCQVTNDQRLAIVEGSAFSKMEEKPTSNGSIRKARDVGALVTLDSFVPTARESKRKNFGWR